MKVIQYVPHGAVPDIRGFAPAIIGQNLAKHMKFAKPYIISNFEHYKSDYEHSRFGDVYRIGESAVYRALFKKNDKARPVSSPSKGCRVFKYAWHRYISCSPN
jgi:hypothetical protein